MLRLIYLQFQLETIVNGVNGRWAARVAERQ